MWDVVGELWSGLAAGGAAITENLWVAICLSFWGSGVWILSMALGWGDALLMPPIQDAGLAPIYSTMLWLSLVLAVLVLLVQIMRAAIRQDGRSLAAAIMGGFKYLLLCAIWVGYCAAVLVAVNGLTKAVRQQLFTIENPAQWQLVPDDLTESTVTGATATVLLILALLLWVAGLSYIVVLLGRSVGLMVLVATAPIAGAGLLHVGLA